MISDRRLLDHHMRVRTAKSKRAYAGSSFAGALTPVHTIARDLHRNGVPRDARAWIVVKCKCGGMRPCCSAKTTLISPATPAADSRWPMFVLTEPMRGLVPDRDLHTQTQSL